MKTVVIPVVVGALSTVKKGMVENMRKVSERLQRKDLEPYLASLVPGYLTSKFVT